ncbi:MAG: DUF3298/DUF4163 domain-containing protein [Bacteroidetes bacterium]|nr:MAG: DUF3298/DUF4163 domain-containing protein [Bacteroidota bacterium]
MFNKKLNLKKIVLLIIISLTIFSCDQEIDLTFSEINFEKIQNAIIDINVPNAEGDIDVSESINSTIANFIVNTISFSEDSLINISLNEAVIKFDSIYIAFKEDFEENSLVWEALIDGEVIYQSPAITCIAINSYLNTGGAHGNMTISFLNFNSQTGQLLLIDDYIKNRPDFIKLAEEYFNIELQESSDETNFDDYFFGEDFHLPENIGFSDDGVILLYNVYEIAPYSEGITEFTIPFEEVLQYLRLN